jgi:hypothetical protein
MTLQHTPSPWIAEFRDRWSPRGDYQALIVTHCDQDHARVICDLGANTLPDAEANATLIANAPDLLQSLQHLLWQWDDCHHLMPMALADARAVVAKCLGEDNG